MAWWRGTEPLPPPPPRVSKTAEERAAEYESARAVWEELHPLLTFRVTRPGGVVDNILGHSYVSSYSSHVRVSRSYFRWGVYSDSYGSRDRTRGVVYEAFDAMSVQVMNPDARR